MRRALASILMISAVLASNKTRIRRLGLSSDGMVWYVNSTMGRIGRVQIGKAVN